MEKASLRVLSGIGMKVAFMLGTKEHGKDVIVGWLSVRCKTVKCATTQGGQDLVNYMHRGSDGDWCMSTKGGSWREIEHLNSIKVLSLQI